MAISDADRAKLDLLGWHTFQSILGNGKWFVFRADITLVSALTPPADTEEEAVKLALETLHGSVT